MGTETVECLDPVERVRGYLARFSGDFVIREFDEDTATCETAAAALGVEPAQIAKSVLFKGGDSLVMVVTCGDTRVDAKGLAAMLGVKRVAMADPDTVLEATGFRVGGVAPFAHPKPIRVLIDDSIKRFPVVYASAGTDRSAVGFSHAELLAVTGGEPVCICGIKG